MSTQHISHLKHNLAYLGDGFFHKKEGNFYLKHNLTYLEDSFFHKKEGNFHLKHNLAYLEDSFFHKKKRKLHCKNGNFVEKYEGYKTGYRSIMLQRCCSYGAKKLLALMA